MIYIGWDEAINPQQITDVEKGENLITNESFVRLYLSNGRKHMRRFATKKEATQYFKEVIKQIEGDRARGKRFSLPFVVSQAAIRHAR